MAERQRTFKTISSYQPRQARSSRPAKEPKPLSPTAKRRLTQLAIVALLAVYFVSAVSAIRNKSTTFDELFHLTAGYSYWTLGDFRIQPENGNLPQRWAALPLLFGGTKFPTTDQDAWRLSSMADIGNQFFYQIGNDADSMLFRGRAMIALLGVALGAIIFFWTRSLLGERAAFVSLALFAFCPTVLTNGALVTSDMAAALFFTASMGCIWRVLHRLTWRTLLLSSLVMGGMFVAKFSAALLVPMGLLIMAVQLISNQPTIVAWRGQQWELHSRWKRLAVQSATIAAHAVVVWIVIWTFYNFRYDMFAQTTKRPNEAGGMQVVDQPGLPWNQVLKETGFVDQTIAKMREARFLPEAYLYGFAHTWTRAQQRSAFLNGKYSIKGWPQFFPYCLMVKTPLTLFVLMALAIAALIRRWLRAGTNWSAHLRAMGASLYRAAPLLSLFIVYWATAIPSHLNIGHRHILPTYPAMLMLAGASVAWLARREKERKAESAPAEKPSADQPRQRTLRMYLPRWLARYRWPIQATMVWGCVGLFAAESLYRWPNYLAYFNQLIGNESNAYRHLVDSSLDWGQELPALKRWLIEQGLDSSSKEKTFLSYFGTGDPAYYDIHATLLPCYVARTPVRIPPLLEEGTYCISATMVQNVYNMFFPGPWNRKYEAIYQQLLA
ncbi:MAG TPA: glycosyltransferase family 39 protein, partial [Pirellulales bacterium]|nr:glycosyltransferase family 39 protein [Pirellulales bacterium]